MKLKYRFLFICAVTFILFVSYKILEPDIVKRNIQNKNNDYDDTRFIPQSTRQALLWNNYTRDEMINKLLMKYQMDMKYEFDSSPWSLAESLVRPREVHPEHMPQLGAILREMNKRKIVAADVGYRGTQLKLSLMLAGGQRVAFKPQWYSREEIIYGKPYDGADRHNGEIAAFHLNRILGFNRSPLVVGRVVDLDKEIKPVAEKRLLQTFFHRGNNTCFYGKCYYCKGEKDGVCAKGTLLEGAVVLWLPSTFSFKHWRHPWGRTYKEGKLAKWETDGSDYCDTVERIPPYDAGPRLLDILDACVFDYLIGNADRHHYETFKGFDESMLIMFDSAKSFGNPHHDERSILAPLYQCCKLRHKTWTILQQLKEGVLTTVLQQILDKDPIAPILTELHYQAMDRRLVHIIKEIEQCFEKFGMENVLIRDYKGPMPFER